MCSIRVNRIRVRSNRVFCIHSNAEVIRALEFSQWLEVLGQLFQAMLKLLRAMQVMMD